MSNRVLSLMGRRCGQLDVCLAGVSVGIGLRYPRRTLRASILAMQCAGIGPLFQDVGEKAP